MDYGYGGGGGGGNQYGGGGNQYSTTTYGRGGKPNDGGFMPGGGSQQSPSGGKRDFKDESLKPVTIKQLLDARDLGNGDSFEIDGATFTQITFVGQVRNITVQETRIRFVIDDGTGEMDVSKFTVETANEETEALPKQDQYVRVHGRLRTIGNKRNVSAMFVRLVTDMNEISYHFLEATLVHLQRTKGPLGANGAAAGANGDDGYGAQNSFSNNPDVAGFSKDIREKLSLVGGPAQKVYAWILNQPQGDEGLKMQDISRQMGLDMNTVKRAGDDLMLQGLIFSTTDEDTWAPMSGME